jgi:UDP-glucose 4-epimerase
VVAIFCGRLLSGQPATIFGDGEQTRDYIFVDDVVRANLAALERGRTGALNIGTGVETSVNRLYTELAEVAGVNQRPTYAPARPGEQQRSVISPERAMRELDWKPQVSLRDGLAQTLRFFRQAASRGA